MSKDLGSWTSAHNWTVNVTDEQQRFNEAVAKKHTADYIAWVDGKTDKLGTLNEAIAAVKALPPWHDPRLWETKNVEQEIPTVTVGTTDPVVNAVREDLLQRSQHGLGKYGIGLDRTDLSLADWLQHAYEECLDQANYLKRAILFIGGKTS